MKIYSNHYQITQHFDSSSFLFIYFFIFVFGGAGSIITDLRDPSPIIALKSEGTEPESLFPDKFLQKNSYTALKSENFKGDIAS